jgi:hypothetical protein
MPVIDPENFFLDIQQAAADILDADAYFDGIPILTEQLGNLDNAIEIVMSKIGLCIVIEAPFADVNYPNVGAVNFDDIPILVTVWEDTTLTRPVAGQKHFIGTALTALWLLTHGVPRKDGEQIANIFAPDSPTMVDLRNTIDREQFPNIQGCQLRFKCSGGYTYTPQPAGEGLLSENNNSLLSELGIPLQPQ